MAEETTFSTGSLQTFVAGAFIVALLALFMSIYNFSRTTQAVSALLDLQAAAVTATAAKDVPPGATADQVSALEARIKSLEDAAAAAAAVATP